MTIELGTFKFDLKDFLFTKVDLTEHLASNCFASAFLTQWISGGKVFQIYTSGSSGEPKEISLKRKWLETSAMQTIGLLNLWEEKIVCCLPTDKIGGLMMIVRALAGGFDIRVIEPCANPMSPVEKDHTYTLISLVPYQLIKILEDEISTLKLNRFKNILLGGSLVSVELLKKIEDLSPAIYHTYGMTETCSHIALKKLNHGKWPHFIPNPYIDIITDNNGLASIRGFQTGSEWIHTTDIIEMYEDGSFDFMGRADFIINTGGFKVFPEILELKIQEILHSKKINIQIAFTGRPHNDWGEELILISDKEINFKEVSELLKPVLKDYEIPKQIVVVEKIPLLNNGKIDRMKLKNLVLEK